MQKRKIQMIIAVLMLMLTFWSHCEARNTTVVYNDDISIIADNDTLCVTKDQIIVSESGLFVDLGDCEVPVERISWLSDNTYEAAFWSSPPKCEHEVYCPICKGCDPTNRCQRRCKCPQRRM